MQQCAGTIKKLVELRRNAPFIVLTMPPDAAAEGAVASKYRNTG
jgi:acyl-CoA reductase-like NAD-dependent aldehyde dehydrogenase